MSEHFIKEIDIKDYKLFKDFKAEGFGRVNLIGGKNNVGKTAFMEACYLINSFKSSYLNNDEPEKIYFEIIKTFIDIQFNRYANDFLIDWILDNYSLNNFSNFCIFTDNYKLSAKENIIDFEPKKETIYTQELEIINTKKEGSFKLFEHQNNKYFYKLRDKNKSLPNIDNFCFLSSCNNSQFNIRKLLSKIKKLDKNELVNKYLQNIFGVNKIDLTDTEVILFKNNKPYNFAEFGDGIKSFINIILTLLYSKNRVIFIDEIENGIHYTNFDKLWEIILTLSKEQNVQVFATTHSYELINSFNKNQKKDSDTFYFELYINKKNKNIKEFKEMRLLDFEQLEYELKHTRRFRGE